MPDVRTSAKNVRRARRFAVAVLSARLAAMRVRRADAEVTSPRVTQHADAVRRDDDPLAGRGRSGGSPTAYLAHGTLDA
jgi:hypothetical protein